MKPAVADTEKNEAAAEWVALDRLHGWDRNPKVHDEGNVAEIAASIRRFGWGAPILARRADGEIIAGHGRVAAARHMGLDRVPVRWMDLDPVDAHLLALADNRMVERSPWDAETLAEVLRDAEAQGAELAGLGWDEGEVAAILSQGPDSAPNDSYAARPTLAERFGVPPFTVLDARQGYWQERKRQWLALGIRSELGRGGAGAYPITGSAAGVTASLHKSARDRAASPGGSQRPSARLGANGRTQRGDGSGRRITKDTEP